MDSINLGMFIVPTIALTLVITLYIYFYKKAADKHRYKYLVASIAILAFALNFAWEVVQGPLYEGYQYDWKHISMCALASIADMFMVLILLFGFGLIYKNVFWIEHLNVSGILVLVLVGGTGAILSEMWHTARGDWTYTESMPLLPWVEVGLSPVLQFMILPALTYSLSSYRLKFYDKDHTIQKDF